MDERKVYDFKGSVTISTEEYRDLIEDCVSNANRADKYRSEGWAKDTTISNLNKESATLKGQLQPMKDFFAENEKAAAEFKAWRLEQKLKEQEEEE